MKNQNFICPHCSKKQQIKKLLLLSNFSKWNCPFCGMEIAPQKKSAVQRSCIWNSWCAFHRCSSKLLFIHAKLQPSQKHTDSSWLWNYLLYTDYHLSIQNHKAKLTKKRKYKTFLTKKVYTFNFICYICGLKKILTGTSSH